MALRAGQSVFDALGAALTQAGVDYVESTPGYISSCLLYTSGAIAVARHAGGRIPGRDVVQDLPGPNRGDRHCKYLSQALQPRSRKGGYQCNGLLLEMCIRDSPNSGPASDEPASSYHLLFVYTSYR